MPERWLPSASTDPNSPFYNDNLRAVQPFSMGVRNCIGQNLAWAQMRLIMSKMMWNFDFERINGKTVRWDDLKTWLLVEKAPIDIKMKMRTD